MAREDGWIHHHVVTFLKGRGRYFQIGPLCFRNGDVVTLAALAEKQESALA